MPKNIEYRKITPQWVEKLARFFQKIVLKKEDTYFHPHPLDYGGAEQIASYQGQDLYILQIIGNEITGYGMLRGWDEGFLIPSLGIAIDPSYRRQGLAKHFLAFMHRKAKDKGAEKIRLSVYSKNVGAIQLYHSFGYTFGKETGHKIVGFYELQKK